MMAFPVDILDLYLPFGHKRSLFFSSSDLVLLCLRKCTGVPTVLSEVNCLFCGAVRLFCLFCGDVRLLKAKSLFTFLLTASLFTFLLNMAGRNMGYNILTALCRKLVIVL